MDYGTVTYNSKELTITEQPYIETMCSDNVVVIADCYQSIATDDEGNMYMVRWTIDNIDCDDESDSCDWDAPYEIKAV